jgi:hypothetical protein
MAGFLDRYQAGEHEDVWAELVALNGQVRREPFRNDAVAVAAETMRRARHNVEAIIVVLDEMGYQFLASRTAEYFPPSNINPFTKEPMPGPRELIRKAMIFDPPDPDAADKILEWERLAGAIPLSIRGWYEVVGEVNLTGSHPRWALLYLDPLVMPSLDSLLRYHRATASRLRRKTVPRGQAFLSLPDYVMKDGLSGAQYWIDLPNAGADAPLEGWSELTTDSEKTYFVAYLRLSFRFGGFPGFAHRASLRKRDRARLTRDLFPL